MRTLFLLFCLACPSLAQAAVGSSAVDTFYAVAGCANNGDGLASTCAASPGASGAFNSLANVIQTVTVGVDDGDTLCVSGKFRETFTPTFSGTAVLPIVINLACNGLTAGTITGADVEASWTGPDADGNYVSGSTYTNPFWVLVDGVASRHGSAQASLTAGQHYFAGSHIYYHGDPSGHTMEIGVRASHIDGTGSSISYVTISGGRFEVTAYGPAKASIVFKDCTGILVTGVTMYANRGGVDFRGSCTASRVTASTLTLVGDGLDANKSTTRPSSIRFDHNTISGTRLLAGTDPFLAGTEATQVAVDEECMAETFAGNDLIYEYNTVSNCLQGISLLPETDVTGLIIRGNTVFNHADDAIGIICGGSCAITQSSINGNLVYDAGSPTSTTSFGIISSASAGSKIDVVNNTVARWGGNYQVSGDGTGDFINNVSLQPTSAAPYHVNFTLWTTVASAAINNNDYYSTATAWWRKSSVRTTLSAFKTDMSPNESASINTNPLFVGTTNFHTQSTSPLRHAGLANTSCIDVRGRVCVVPPDMGAYQATSGDLGADRSVRLRYIFQPVASSTFSSGTANPLSESGVWATNQSGGGAFQISAAIANPTDLTQDSGARYIGTGFNQNQYSRGNLTITGTAGGGSGIGLSICASSSARTMYRFVIDHATSNNASLYRYVAGVGTLLTGGAWTQTFSDADQFTFANVSETLYVFRASTLVKTIDDTGGGVGCASTRFPGLAFSSTETSASVGNWSGGNFHLAY